MLSELLQMESIDPPPLSLGSDLNSIAPVWWTGIQWAIAGGQKKPQRFFIKQVKKAPEKGRWYDIAKEEGRGEDLKMFNNDL